MTLFPFKEILDGDRQTAVRIYDADGNPVGEENPLKTEVTGSGITSPLVTGTKTVNDVAAEVFAGSSRLSERASMTVFNEGNVTIYIGGDNVTVNNGFPLLAGDSARLEFRGDIAIYAIADTNATIRVVEAK